MGKKKDKRREREQAHDAGHSADSGHTIPPQIAGVAAMVMGQLSSPAGRQMVAAGLRAAASAIGGDTARAPVPPIPPVPPAPGEAKAAEGTGASINVPPEAARVIGMAASALERFAQNMARPKG